MTDNDHVKALKDELKAIQQIDRILARVGPAGAVPGGRLPGGPVHRKADVNEPRDPRRVPDLPCPKCGSDETTMRWYGGLHRFMYGAGTCFDPSEHFHRECFRCHARWVTTDMLDAEQGADDREVSG